MEIKFKRFIGCLLMLIACAIPFYCFGEMVWQSWTQESRYQVFTETSHRSDIDEQLQKSQDYNQQLNSSNSIVDPFLGKHYRVDYGILNQPNDVYGYLSIPVLQLMEPVYLGADDFHLSNGLAHIEGTALPVEGSNIRSIIAGHRVSLNHVFFRNIDQLTAGDRLYYDNGKEIAVYQMVDSEIIFPSEWEKLQPKSDKNLLTLMTCDPIPIYNQRLLVNFERVSLYSKDTLSENDEEDQLVQLAFTQDNVLVSDFVMWRYWLYLLICFISGLGILFSLIRAILLIRK